MNQVNQVNKRSIEFPMKGYQQTTQKDKEVIK